MYTTYIPVEDLRQTCAVAEETSFYVYEWVKAQSSVGEESITDWMLYNLSKWSKRIQYVKFTRSEESKKTGADWEWWILFDFGALGARIQAKRMKSPKENYNALHYKPNNNDYQIRKLIEDALSEKMLPLYAFYTDVITTSTMCVQQSRGTGIFIAGAEKVHDISFKSTITDIPTKDILDISNPFSCFVCCPLILQNDIQDYFHHYFDSRSLRDNGLRSINDIPSYVSRLYGLSISGEITGNLNDQLNTVPNANAILITDLRQIGAEG